MATKSEQQTHSQMCEMYEKLARPGDQHRWLERFSGKFEMKGKAWPEPDKPVETHGTIEQWMVLGGRYLEQKIQSSDENGMRFEGRGLIGYDNQLSKFLSIWIDTMMTGIMNFEGSASLNGSTLTQRAKWTDPVRGPMTFRTEQTIVSDREQHFEMYWMDATGHEDKIMEAVYKRV